MRRVLLSWSSGKDSAWTLHVLRKRGELEVAGLLTTLTREHGRVSMQMRTPTEDVVLDTAHDGDVVGWSWLIPPYRWTFDARATEDTSAIAFDGLCLRGKCESDATLGYAMLQRVVCCGTGRAAILPGNRPVAGKTGTAQDYTNVYFAGYTPQVATAVGTPAR